MVLKIKVGQTLKQPPGNPLRRRYLEELWPIHTERGPTPPRSIP